MRSLIKAALIRTARTAIQYIVGTLPPGAAITPTLLQNLSWDVFKYVVAAWLIGLVLDCIATFGSAMLTGLPEADPSEDDDAFEDDVVPADEEMEEDEDSIDDDYDDIEPVGEEEMDEDEA